MLVRDVKVPIHRCQTIAIGVSDPRRNVLRWLVRYLHLRHSGTFFIFQKDSTTARPPWNFPHFRTRPPGESMHVIRTPTHASAAVLPRPIIPVTVSLFFSLSAFLVGFPFPPILSSSSPVARRLPLQVVFRIWCQSNLG